MIGQNITSSSNHYNCPMVGLLSKLLKKTCDGRTNPLSAIANGDGAFSPQGKNAMSILWLILIGRQMFAECAHSCML